MEDDGKTGWFHCGRCGEFFGAEVGEGVPGSCPDCGGDPVIDPSEAAFAHAVDDSGPTGGVDGESGRGAGGTRRHGKTKRKRERSGLAVFVGIWLCVLVIMVGAVKYFRGSSDGEDDQLGFGVMSEDQLLVAGQINECRRKVAAYLDAGVPEGRAEFVMNPVETLGRMTGRQRDFPLSSDESDLQQVIAGAIGTPKGKAIESVWEIDGGRSVEAVFFSDEKGEWRIDWPNMVRYSDQDWSLFLVGSGGDEGEFRLLARRRSDDSKRSGAVESVVLIGPRAGSPGELGASSPEVPVDPDSRIGRVLAAAFAKRDAGEGIYGSKSAEMDPNGMIRLRAKIVRQGGTEGERSFVIREILACHWYDFDDLGLGK